MSAARVNGVTPASRLVSPAENGGEHQREDGAHPDRNADVVQHWNLRKSEQAKADHRGDVGEEERVVRSDRHDQEEPYQVEDVKRMVTECQHAGGDHHCCREWRNYVEYAS